jgi:hypothetical protein
MYFTLPDGQVDALQNRFSIYADMKIVDGKLRH